jgi:uncharacterized protein (TIGR02145 family)
MKTNTKLFFASLAMILGLNPIIQAQTVTIGTQVWTTKNLDVSTFRNGDVIPQATTDEAWEAAGENKQPAWCYYDNDTANASKYGKLYNWYAVNDPRGLAPAGYHIPTDAEWTVLTDYMGGEGIAGKKMKISPIFETKVTYVEEGGYQETKYIPCSNCSYWTEKQRANNPCSACRNTRGKYVSTGKYIPKTKRKVEEKVNGGWDGDNSSGFSGLPGGFRYGDGWFTFSSIGMYGYWWSATESAAGNAFSRGLGYSVDGVYGGGSSSGSSSKGGGLSVRCVKD